MPFINEEKLKKQSKVIKKYLEDRQVLKDRLQNKI